VTQRIVEGVKMNAALADAARDRFGLTEWHGLT
jgi:hypothetical protein